MLISLGRSRMAASSPMQKSLLLLGVALFGLAPARAEAPGEAVVLPDAPSATLTSHRESKLPFLRSANFPLQMKFQTADVQQAPASPQQPSTEPNSQAPSLSDLGITNKEVQADPDLQAKLDRRSHMLKVHQRWGLITLVPMAAACISSVAAGPDPKKGGNNTWRDVHLALGATTAVSYGITASYAIRAPRVPHGHTKGAIKLHKILAWVHGPGIIATPILGAMAYNQAADGHKPTGAASAHGAIATTTVIAYGAALLAVSLPIRMGGH